MKVKFFVARDITSGFRRSGDHARKWEEQLNAWLANNPQARVVFVEQTAAGGSFLSSQWLISVWYEDSAA